MDKNTIVPDKYKPWVMIVWTAVAVIAMSSAENLLEALGRIGWGTLFIIGGIFVSHSIKEDKLHYEAGYKDALYDMKKKK
jgi:hypothetical protein